MNEPSTYYPNLIARYLSGEAGEGEMRELASWLKESADNEILFREMSIAANLVDAAAVERVVDADEEWRNFNDKIAKQPKLTVVDGGTRSRFFLYRWQAVAAVFVALVVAVWALVRLTSGPDMITLTADGSRCPFRLPDGTLVVMNRGTISYPDKFASDQRFVELTGEAWFEVAHDSLHPFIVGAGDLRLKVLGTKFYIESKNEGGSASVVLDEGSVALYRESRKEEPLVLVPGDRATVSPDQMTKTVNTNPNYIAWKTGRISFNNEPLSEVAAVLSKVYEKNIMLGNSAMANCRLTADFDQLSLDAILQIVSSTLDLKVEKHGETILLSGKGCR